MIRHRQLQALEAVLSSRTMTLAADRFCVTQPAMSRLIAQLESEVGFLLLRRERGRITLTPEGERFWGEAKRVLEAMQRLQAAANEIRDNSTSKIQIIALPGLIHPLVSKPIAEYAIEQPGVRVSIEAHDRDRIEEVMGRHQFDIGLAVAPVDVPPGFELTSLVVVPAVCILPVNHPLATKRVIGPEDLAGAPFVSYRRGSFLREYVDKLFSANGVQRALLYESPSAENVCELVASGVGVSIITASSLGTLPWAVTQRPFVPEISVEYVMLRPGERGRSREVERLAELIQIEAKAIGDKLTMAGNTQLESASL